MYHNEFEVNMQYPSIFDLVKGDVNGDGIPDKIYLTGIKNPDSPFVLNITLVIQDGRTEFQTSVPLEENAGYNPTLYLEDFTGNGIDDILISIASGGSGGIMFYYIFSFIHNIARMMFDFNVYNEQYKYSVTYKNNYKVQVISKYKCEEDSSHLPISARNNCTNGGNNAEYIIDISNRDSDYLNEIYDELGILKNPIEGFVDPLSGLYPIDFDSNKVYGLLAFQKISGRYHADSLGFVQNVLKWDKNKFVLENQFVAIMGTNVNDVK